MAYTRWNESGHYIYGGVDYVDFNGKAIPDDDVDVFIYKLFEKDKNGGEDFWERYHHGSRVINNFHKGIILKRHCKHTYTAKQAASEISALAREIWLEHYTPIIGAEQVEYMLAKFQSAERILEDINKNAFVYFTAEHIKHKKAVGYAACKPEGDYLFLSKMYTHKDYRGNRIARSFLDEILALCRWEIGAKKIRLTVNKSNEGSIAAYKKMGFEVIESIKVDIGSGFFMDDYLMEILV